MTEDWTADWRPLIEQIGQDFSDGKTRYGVDRIEAGMIRRCLEPLEFDCPLHYDPEIARAHGHRDVTAPYTAVIGFTMPSVWRPGDAVFTSAERNARPGRASGKPKFPKGTPPIANYFATDVEIDYLRPIIAGERIGRRGNRLVACAPKETTIGRGAFVTFESEVVDEAGEAVARIRAGLFLYNPHPKAGE